MRRRRNGLGSRFDILGPSVAVAALSVILYLPFYVSSDPQLRGILPVAETGTNWGHYPRIWGPLLIAIPLAGVTFWSRVRDKGLGPAIAGAVIAGVAPLVVWTVAAPLWPVLSFDAVPAVDAGSISRRWFVVLPAGLVFAAGIGALMPSRWTRMPAPGTAFALLVITAGAFAVLMPELFFVSDAFGTRMNTVFKMHYQAWVLFSVAAGFGAAWLLTRPRPVNTGVAGVSLAAIAFGAVLVVVGTAYAPAAAWTRVSTSHGASLALDGLSKFSAEYPDEASAIRWLHHNAVRGAVVLEAVGTPERFDYSDFSRVSAITGIPTVLGWQGHEAQWRASAHTYLGRRESVDAIYAASDPQESRRLMELYGVDYVFVGRLEQERYGKDVVVRLNAVVPEARTRSWGEVAILDVRPS